MMKLLRCNANLYDWWKEILFQEEEDDGQLPQSFTKLSILLFQDGESNAMVSCFCYKSVLMP